MDQPHLDRCVFVLGLTLFVGLTSLFASGRAYWPTATVRVAAAMWRDIGHNNVGHTSRADKDDVITPALNVRVSYGSEVHRKKIFRHQFAAISFVICYAREYHCLVRPESLHHMKASLLLF
jgi:hypothetical protein